MTGLNPIGLMAPPGAAKPTTGKSPIPFVLRPLQLESGPVRQTLPRQTLPIVMIVGTGLAVVAGLLGVRGYRHHRAQAQQGPVFLLTPDSRFYGNPPRPVSDAEARPQPDGSLLLTWKGGEGCDAFLITRQSAQQFEPEKLADVPSGQLKIDLPLSSGTAWDFDLWIQGHNAKFGYVAPRKVRPAPAPEGIAAPPQ